jgi:hypothetical protein
MVIREHSRAGVNLAIGQLRGRAIYPVLIGFACAGGVPEKFSGPGCDQRLAASV